MTIIMGIDVVAIATTIEMTTKSIITTKKNTMSIMESTAIITAAKSITKAAKATAAVDTMVVAENTRPLSLVG